MAKVGINLVEQGEGVDQVYFFYRGAGMLTREFSSDVYGTTQLECGILPEGSFWGELPCLLGITSYFSLKVNYSRTEKIKIDGSEHCHIYYLEKEDFMDILADYPSFETSIYIRGEIRVAYFKHQA